MLVLTPPLSAVAYYCSPASTFVSPSIADKAALLTFPNKADFVKVRIQITQYAVIGKRHIKWT